MEVIDEAGMLALYPESGTAGVVAGSYGMILAPSLARLEHASSRSLVLASAEFFWFCISMASSAARFAAAGIAVAITELTICCIFFSCSEVKISSCSELPSGGLRDIELKSIYSSCTSAASSRGNRSRICFRFWHDEVNQASNNISSKIFQHEVKDFFGAVI